MKNDYLEEYILILKSQRYSENSITVYSSYLSYFLKLSSKYNPEELL
jgi:hypothetical protein